MGDKQTIPSISFGEKMFISASMCNDFNGLGAIHNSKLTVKNLSKTELECVDEELSKWDLLISQMLTHGVAIMYSKNQLVLTQGHNKLVYTLKDYIS